MPIRVRSRVDAHTERDGSPIPIRYDFQPQLPQIHQDDDFPCVVKKLSLFFRDVIELPSTFEQLRTTAAGTCLRVLVDHLGETCTNPAIVNALLALKWHYDADQDNQTLGESRSYACEIVAWRFLTRLCEREAVDYCLYEIPDSNSTASAAAGLQSAPPEDEEAAERRPLLSRSFPSQTGYEAEGSPTRPVSGSIKRFELLKSVSRLANPTDDTFVSSDNPPQLFEDPAASFQNLNALEIAAIANAKRFLSQHVVQKIITGIWNGDIIFWDSLSVQATKKPRFYNPTTADVYSRLRVPKYLKCWEVVFFAIFLCLYYTVLLKRVGERVTLTEIGLFFWIAAFFYDELSEWIDAGSVFYATDIWNLFDMVMILIGFLFGALRIVGVMRHSGQINDLAFNVLSLEALFMIPRICSILSLSPYWGTLIPCLKEMGKDFLKFMVLVVIIYVGFLTTFSLVGRDVFSLSHMTGILTKIFYGSSYVGFDIMYEIDPIFGPPLMIIFITLSSFLLMGSLTGMLSNSFSRVMGHAKEEYLYVYSVYVLEASTSNRLTHFYPPFNLLAFVIFRPWRLILPSDEKFRAGRIVLLKVTHTPIVIFIKLYETLRRKVHGDEYARFKGPRTASEGAKPETPRGKQAGATVAFRTRLLPHRSSQTAVEEDTQTTEDDVDAPTLVEVQMNELNRKIDQLTELVLALQSQKDDGGAST